MDEMIVFKNSYLNFFHNLFNQFFIIQRLKFTQQLTTFNKIIHVAILTFQAFLYFWLFSLIINLDEAFHDTQG